CSEMAGHFPGLVMWLVRLSILPLGKSSPQSLQVCGYRFELSASLGPRWKYDAITWFGLRPMVAICARDDDDASCRCRDQWRERRRRCCRCCGGREFCQTLPP